MRKQLMILLMTILMVPNLWAQEKLSISLDEAKTYALQFNKTILNSGLAVQKSQEQTWEAISAGLPQLNASADYNNAMGAEISIQFDESMPASKIPIKPTSTFNMQVGQLIFSANYLVGIKTAKIYEQLTAKSQTKTEQDVISQVINNYYLVLIADASLKILNNNVGNLQEVYDKTAPMVEFGMMEQVELDQLSVQVNTLLNTVKSAERQLELSTNMLRFQLGVPVETELLLTDSLDLILQKQMLAINSNDQFDINQNIDYQLVETQGELQKRQIDMQKAGYLPTVSGYYSFTHKILKPAFDMTPKNMIGLQMNIPIFASGEKRSRVRQAEIDYLSYQNDKAMLQDQLLLQYKQLSFNLRNALENYENQSKNVEVSRKVYDSFHQRFDQGVISSLELTTSDNNYLNAESDYLRAILQVLQAQNDLNTLSGKLNINNQEQ